MAFLNSICFILLFIVCIHALLMHVLFTILYIFGFKFNNMEDVNIL